MNQLSDSICFYMSAFFFQLTINIFVQLQSFGLPPLIPKPELPAEFNVKEDSLGISHPMISG